MSVDYTKRKITFTFANGLTTAGYETQDSSEAADHMAYFARHLGQDVRFTVNARNSSTVFNLAIVAHVACVPGLSEGEFQAALDVLDEREG